MSSLLVPRRGFEPQAKQAADASGFAADPLRSKALRAWGVRGSHIPQNKRKQSPPKRGQLLPWADKSLLFARHEGLAWDGFGKGGDSLPDDLQSARGAAAITKREDMLLHVLSFGASSGIRTPDTLLKRQVLCRLS